MHRLRAEGGGPAGVARHVRGAHGAVGLGDALVLGLSGSGPAQTLAVSLASMVAAASYGGAIPVLLCFVPMLGIAVGYQRLNRWDPSAGATYTWVARVFHPYLGFLAGWMILLYYTLGTSSLTIPAGTYTLELVAPAARRAARWPWRSPAVRGTSLSLLLALKGLKVAARFEWPIVIVPVRGAAAGRRQPARCALAYGGRGGVLLATGSRSTGLGGMRGLMGGILIACFMYSGWDAAIYVNEESSRPRQQLRSCGHRQCRRSWQSSTPSLCFGLPGGV